MARRKIVRLPKMLWYGNGELEIDFPDAWDVTVCKMHGHDAPPLDAGGIRKAFDNPIGSKAIRELARGKKEVVILFDDMTRPTPSAVLVPYILEELTAAGIPDSGIRFIAAPGAHGKMTNLDFTKKLGEGVVDRFPVYNHNPYDNCTPIGMTKRGIPVSINSEVMSCDLKIGIGSIIPHADAGFGGGGKIILPGVASMDTIEANHTRLIAPQAVRLANITDCEGNIMKQDIDEIARMAGLDIKIDALVNLKGEITHLFVGDHIEGYSRGTEEAKGHYATDMVRDVDIVIANCYSKATEMLLAPNIASPLLSRKGGDMVVIAVTPEGQTCHYLYGSFGKNITGRAWECITDLPINTRRLTIMAPYPDKAGAEWLTPANSSCTNRVKTWVEVIETLEKTYGDQARVAVIPDATVQYFPEAASFWETLAGQYDK